MAGLLIDHVEFVPVVGGDDVRLEPGKFAENPAVQTGQLIVRHAVLGRIEIVEIGEFVAQRIADDTVGFANLIDPLVADDGVIAEILGSHPEAQDVRAIFLDINFRCLRFLVDLAPLALEIFSGRHRP